MNLDRIKPETLAAGVMDYMPQSLAAHEYAERLNAALARLGLTDRLTLPPAPNTAIDELPAVVDVPLRKTLSVLMGKAQQGDASALATLEWTAQVMESIFAGLHARASVYPLALPSHESLATLSQGVDALLPRKISNGAWSLLSDGTPSDGIDDGVSLVRLLCSSAADSVTELKDDNEGWVMTKALPSLPNLERLKLCCSKIYAAPNNYEIFYQSSSIKHADLSAIEEITCITRGGVFKFPNGTVDLSGLKVFNGFSIHDNKAYALIANGQDEVLNLSSLISVTSTGSLVGNGVAVPIAAHCSNLKEVYMPKMTSFYTGQQAYPEGNANSCYYFTSCPNIEKIVLGKLVAFDSANFTYYQPSSPMLNLIHLEIGEGTGISLKMAQWNPTSVLSDSERLPEFLSNFQTYIADRVADRTDQPALTLTLSAAVYEALQAQEGQTILATLTNKNWTVAQA